MANTAKAVTSDTTDGNVRRIVGTLGADGTLIVGERLYGFTSITIQLTGTFNSSVQTVQVSNNGSDFVGLPTAVTFSAAGLKAIVGSELGFYAMQFSGASAGGSSAIAFTIIAQKG